MKKTIGIIGLGRFGLELLERLVELNIDVIGIDNNEELVKHASEFSSNVFIADATNEKALKDCGITNCDNVIICMGQDHINNLTNIILIIIKLKQLGVKQITARSDKEDYIETLKLVGATNIISPLSIAAERLANKFAFQNVVDYFNIKNDYDVYEVHIDENFKSIPITELSLRSKYKMNILLIERNKDVIFPTSLDYLNPNDNIFIFGRKKDLPKVVDFFTKNL